MKRAIFFLVSIIFLSANGSASAADISGKVTIFEKDGEKTLKSFSNAIVYIDFKEAAYIPEPALVDQSGKKFIPRLLPVVSGQEIRFLNSDQVRHNVFSPDPDEPFDLGRYPKGESKSVVLKKIGRHKIYCDIHQNMVSDIFVVPGRYFSLTDEKGDFIIRNVPRGKHKISVWHILEGEDAKEIVIDEKSVPINFEIKSARIIKEIESHPDKSGRDYDDWGYKGSGSNY